MTDVRSLSIPEYRPVVISIHDGDRVRIDQAPPQAYIGADLLMSAMDGEVRLMTVSGEGADIVTISDDFGQRFIYRLGAYEALYDAFEMEWPD